MLQGTQVTLSEANLFAKSFHIMQHVDLEWHALSRRKGAGSDHAPAESPQHAGMILDWTQPRRSREVNRFTAFRNYPANRQT